MTGFSTSGPEYGVRNTLNMTHKFSQLVLWRTLVSCGSLGARHWEVNRRHRIKILRNAGFLSVPLESSYMGEICQDIDCTVGVILYRRRSECSELVRHARSKIGRHHLVKACKGALLVAQHVSVIDAWGVMILLTLPKYPIESKGLYVVSTVYPNIDVLSKVNGSVMRRRRTSTSRGRKHLKVGFLLPHSIYAANVRPKVIPLSHFQERLSFSWTGRSAYLKN